MPDYIFRYYLSNAKIVFVTVSPVWLDTALRSYFISDPLYAEICQIVSVWRFDLVVYHVHVCYATSYFNMETNLIWWTEIDTYTHKLSQVFGLVFICSLRNKQLWLEIMHGLSIWNIYFI